MIIPNTLSGQHGSGDMRTVDQIKSLANDPAYADLHVLQRHAIQQTADAYGVPYHRLAPMLRRVFDVQPTADDVIAQAHRSRSSLREELALASARVAEPLSPVIDRVAGDLS